MRRSSDAVATTGPVLIIGTGLLGTSIGLALSRAGVEVLLSDTSPTSQRLAEDMGAGRPVASMASEPTIVVVATPPDVAGPVVAEALRTYPNAVVTDVASVKEEVLNDVLGKGNGPVAGPGAPELASRYVGSHPMAGRERSGASAADPDLFIGRPWVIVPHDGSSSEAVLAVRTLGTDMGSVTSVLDAHTHDRAVALVSHVPQLVSSLLAGRLRDAPAEALALSGQGLRDTTRIAASDPRLWTSILAGNAGHVTEILGALRSDLDELLSHLSTSVDLGIYEGGSVGAVNTVMQAGNEGVARIPGKHGGAPQRFAEVEVLVPDEPGELGRLFTELGEADVNIEDFSLDHSAGQQVGVAHVLVNPARARDAELELDRRGWRVVSRHSASTEEERA